MADTEMGEPTPRHFRREESASGLLRDVNFPTAVRGYDRRAVDEFLEDLRNLVAALEARQTREGVVQKALDEIGEETAGILQRAHETADEIAARSRAQADGRLQRAEREAEIVRREADEYAEQVIDDTRALWEERQRLIEDLRHLADEVLGTADDALERLKLPDPLSVEESERTTAEDAVTPIPHPLSIAPRDDPSVPYDLEEPADEVDPNATAAWPADAADEEHDPDATAPYAIAGEDEPAEDEPVEDDENAGHTVELEALPGGNSDESAAEPERERD